MSSKEHTAETALTKQQALDVVLDMIKQLVDYSKWLIATSALMLGLFANVVKDVKKPEAWRSLGVCAGCVTGVVSWGVAVVLSAWLLTSHLQLETDKFPKWQFVALVAALILQMALFVVCLVSMSLTFSHLR